MVLVTQDVPSLPASPSQLSQPKPQLPQQEPQLRPAAPETAVSVLKTQIPKSAFWGGKILKSANALYSKKKGKKHWLFRILFYLLFSGQKPQRPLILSPPSGGNKTKVPLVLSLLTFFFSQWIYLGTDFWEFVSGVPEGAKKKSHTSTLSIEFFHS